MFKKLLASLGKGAATVDLRLHQEEYLIGDCVQGDVIVRGGEVAQNINGIQVGLFAETHHEGEKTVRQMDSISISGSFVIRANEEKVFPFTHQLLPTLPLTSPSVSFYYDTHLDIEGGIDKKDVDVIRINPANEVATVFRAFDAIGFRQTATSGKLDHRGQEFAFFPTTHFQHEVNEVECRFAYEEHGIRMWMEVDVKQGFHEKEIQRSILLTEEFCTNQSDCTACIEELIRESIVSSEFSPTDPHDSQSHGQADHHGSPIAGMVGGLAAGIAGGMLINEMVDAFTEDEESDEEEDEE